MKEIVRIGSFSSFLLISNRFVYFSALDHFDFQQNNSKTYKVSLGKSFLLIIQETITPVMTPNDPHDLSDLGISFGSKHSETKKIQQTHPTSNPKNSIGS